MPAASASSHSAPTGNVRPSIGDLALGPPGHIPVKKDPGTEFASFSPSDELRSAEAVMMKNMQAIAGRLNALGAEARGGTLSSGRRPC